MIKFIYGKTTQGQIDHLKTLISGNRSLDDFDLILAEDRFTMSLENELLDSIPGKSSFSFNVYSFSRLTNTLAAKKSQTATLSKTGGVMAISRILLDIADELKCYKHLAARYSTLSESLFEIIAQLKSSMISFNDLKNTKSSSISLTNKAHDIGLIYEKYESFKTENTLDAQDKIALLADLIDGADLIKNSRIIIIGFTSFTTQFYKVLGKLFANAKECVVYILDGENEIYDKTVSKRLIDAANAVNAEYENIFLNENLDEEHEAINKYLFSFIPKEQIKTVETDKITLRKCTNFTKELEKVSVDILKKIKRGAKFSDFAVLCSSVETNGELIRKTFEDYNIPAFFDSKIKLIDHILSKTVISLLNLSKDEYLRKSSSSESLLTILYSPYIEGTSEDKQNFENYLLKKGIKRSTIKKPLEDELNEGIRSQIFSLIPKTKQLADIKSYALCVKKLLSEIIDKNEIAFDLFEKAGETEFAALTLQCGDKFNEVLDEMVRLIGDTTIALDDFIAILSDGLSAKELSLAPLYSDCVFVGDFSSSKILKKKHLFAVSVNNKLVPFQKADVGLLTDKDIDGLLLGGVNLEPKIEIVNEREKLNVFLSLMNFEESLALSYSDFSSTLEALGKSEVISSFEDIFTYHGKPIEPKPEDIYDLFSDEGLSSYIENQLPSKRVIEKAASLAYSEKTHGNLFVAAKHVFENREKNVLSTIEKKPERIVENAFDSKKIFSVSDLESYFSCPYKNFVSHSLYAKEREEAVIKPTDSGNYIHEALEILMKELPKLDDEKAKEYAKNITENLKKEEPYATMNRIPRYSIALSRLDREFFDVSDELIKRRAKSSFVQLGEEIRFGYGKTINVGNKTYDLSPLTLPNGEKLRGSIDYADFYNGYARVIDYKTGTIHEKINDVYNGQKFQPYIYLSALYKSLGLLPAGALYFPVHADFSDDTSSSPYKMKGYVVADKAVLNHMDSDLPNLNTSATVNVKYTQNGSINKNSSVLTSSEFDYVIKYSEKLAEKATTEIRNGNIGAKPYVEACKYCDYKGMCGYDLSLDGERKITGEVSISTITEAVSDEQL